MVYISDLVWKLVLGFTLDYSVSFQKTTKMSGVSTYLTGQLTGLFSLFLLKSDVTRNLTTQCLTAECGWKINSEVLIVVHVG